LVLLCYSYELLSVAVRCLCDLDDCGRLVRLAWFVRLCEDRYETEEQ